MGQVQKVAEVSALAPGQAKCVEAGGKAIALFNVGGTFYALDDACTHVGGNLSEGEVDGATVICPWHGARFDLKTGTCLGPPATVAVKSYPLQIRGQDILVDVG